MELRKFCGANGWEANGRWAASGRQWDQNRSLEEENQNNWVGERRQNMLETSQCVGEGHKRRNATHVERTSSVGDICKTSERQVENNTQGRGDKWQTLLVGDKLENARDFGARPA